MDCDAARHDRGAGDGGGGVAITAKFWLDIWCDIRNTDAMAIGIAYDQLYPSVPSEAEGALVETTGLISGIPEVSRNHRGGEDKRRPDQRVVDWSSTFPEMSRKKLAEQRPIIFPFI
jgi:hypothetical protein